MRPVTTVEILEDAMLLVVARGQARIIEALADVIKLARDEAWKEDLGEEDRQ